VLKQLLDGVVPEPEQTRLQGHLETCVACQQRLQQLAAGSDSWAEAAHHLGAEPPRGDALRLAMEKLRDKDQLVLTQDEADGREEISLSFLDPPAKPRQLGKLDHYEIIEVIGRGGMGIVFKALDPALHRIVAVKVMTPQLASIPSAQQRFLREARAAAAVCHEHVVTIHAVAEVRGLPYLVMQFVAGMSLQDRLERGGPLNLDEVLRIGMQTAQGLAAAHAQGLVHRDIKPANILLENGVERVKITDFGLARAANDARVTQSGVIVGTPQYMAPEQARGETVDHRADLFSLGSVLYFMCTGQPPFQGDSSLAVLRRVCDETPPPITEINPNTPDWLVEIIARLQSKESDERFQSATEVAELLGGRYASLQQSRSQPTIHGEAVSEAVCMIAPATTPVTLEPSTKAEQHTRVKSSGKSKWPLVLGISAAVVVPLLCCGGITVALFAFLGFAVLGVSPQIEQMRPESVLSSRADADGAQEQNNPPQRADAGPVREPPPGGPPPAPPLVAPAEEAIPKITAPHLTKSKVEVPLSEPFAQVRTGGGGRYLVFHLKKAKKLAIFDVTAVEVVKEIELPTEDVVYACGRDKLMIVLPGQRLIQRWDLRSFECEKTAPAPGDGPVRQAVMGCFSPGPLLLWSGGKVAFFDVERMEPCEVEAEGKEIAAGTQQGLELRASADGRTFVAWTPHISPENYRVMRLSGQKATVTLSPDGQSFNEHWAMSNADGSLIFRHAAGIYTSSVKALAAGGDKDTVLLPTEDARFFLKLRKQMENKDQIDICTTADRRCLWTVSNAEKMTASLLYTQWGLAGGEPRIHYLPSADVLLTLPESNDRVVVRPLDLFASLDRDGKNYLFVLSAPRTRARSGAMYDYLIDIHSKAGGVRCKLEAHPKGMTISSDGRLRWQVPPGPEGKTANVIVNIRDASGKEIQHSFEVVVE
jgi:serine/threonine protein kinase